MIAAALLFGTICAGTTGAGCLLAGYPLLLTIAAYTVAGFVSTLLFLAIAMGRQARSGDTAGELNDRTPGGQVPAFE